MAAGSSHRRELLALSMAAALVLEPLAAAAGPILPDPLSVDINSQGYYQGLWGDRSRSFLTQGWFQQHNLNARYSKTLENGLEVNSQINGQATDDPLVTTRRGKWQVLGGFFSAEKPQNYRIEGGNIVPQASRATLTASVLGFGGYYQINREGAPTRVTLIGGQIQPPVEGTQFQRGVVGGSLSQGFKGEPGSLKIQGNAFRVEDLLSTIEHSQGLDRLATWVYSANADIRSRTGLGLAAEAAFARNDGRSIDGTSLWLSPSYRKDLFSVTANLERNSPRFINPVGSAAPDVNKADASLAYGKVHQVTLNGLYTTNNVEGQLAATSKTRSVGTTVKTVPFENSGTWKALSLNADYRLTRSDGFSRGQSQQLGAGAGLTTEGISGSLRGEFIPSRDYIDPANDRNTYRVIWQMGFRLANETGWTLGPYWNLSKEWSRLRSNALTNRSETIAAGLTSTYSDWLAMGIRHDLQRKLSQPGERKLTNNSTQASVRAKIKTKVPLQAGISYTYKDYKDSTLNRFGENELRATLSAKF